jgi:Putative MetA-pathway of phenol degradation
VMSRPRQIRLSLGLWTLGLFLTMALAMPAEAQGSRSFTDMLLRWPEPKWDDEREANTEEEREEFIETDRNSFTFSPFTPGSGRLIVESAYSYINIGHEGPKHSFPETVFRYGIGDRLELRLGYNFETGRASEAAEGDIAGNFGINAKQQIFYGFKYAVTRQKPEFCLMPHSAFLAQAHTPVGSVEGQSQIRLGYVWGWMLANGWTLDQGVRFGTDREGREGYTLWAPSTVLRIPLGREKRWFTHLEYFGIMSQAKERDFSKQFIDTGLHYFITPNLEVGTVVAFGINEQTRGVLVNVGFGVRF